MPPTGTYNPAITLESILLSIQLLLATPNPDDPLQGEAADLYKSNVELFNIKARESVLMFGKECVVQNPNAEDKKEESKEEIAKKRQKLSCLK